MAAYNPPTQNLPIFDADFFLPDDSNPLTLAEAEKLFVKNTNAFISNSLNVGGNTILLGNLSIPSYPDVELELQNIDASLNSIVISNTGISYNPIGDLTTIDNNVNITGTLSIPSYPDVSQQLLNIDASLNVIDGSLNVIDGSLNAIDGSLNVIDGSLNVIDGSLNAIDASLNAIDASLNAIDGSLNIIDGSLNVIDGSLNVIDGSLNVIDGSLNAIDASLNVIDGSLNAIDANLTTINTNLTDITYNASAVTPYVADSTIINNHIYCLRNGYFGNAQSSYIFAGSGTYRRRRVFNMIDTDAVVKIARFSNANPPIIEFEGWNDIGAGWFQQHFWQMRANNTNILFQNYTTSGVQSTTNSFEIGLSGVSPNISYLPLGMNAQPINNIAISTTTNNTYGDMKYDATAKEMYYKPSVYGQFSLSSDFTLTSANTEYNPTYNTTINALNCVIQGSPANQIKVDVAGLYRITVSPNIQSGSANTAVDFWFKKNGTNIANSCSRITTKNGSVLPFVEIFETMNANDYIQIAISADATGVILDSTGTQTSPTRPATPSIIVTIQRIN
jgi:archaellum component FlaC